MAYIQHTNVPNSVFDSYLSSLGYAELKVLLVIIRQTYGWKSKHGKGYKKRDWISRAFFVKKTGLSKRAVSKAIADLSYKQLITITNERGRVLHSTIQRKHSDKLYFSCSFSAGSDFKSTKAVTKSNPTIIKHTKVYREETSLGLQKLHFKYHTYQNNDKDVKE